MSKYILSIGKQAKEASTDFVQLSVIKRNQVLENITILLKENKKSIFEANELDLKEGKKKGLTAAMLDRLTITEERLTSMVDGIKRIISFEDPVGQSGHSWQHENGMQISEISVPLGVIGMIYESRPNVTVDVAALAIKSGNCVVLRGGSEAIKTNCALADVIREALNLSGVNQNVVQLVENTDRELVKAMITMNDYLDVVIPRGGRSLKKAIINHASVPVIETGEGLCHTYVDGSADLEMALNIVVNAKTQRTGVCNAMETLLVHKSLAESFLPMVESVLDEKRFEIRACDQSMKYLKHGILAVDEDWETEYLDAILSIKLVASLEEAIQHIERYGSGHSEAIVTESYKSSERFLKAVDAAAVYVNASTRFTDGDVFGFGGEVGISTQKLHARGPMGIKTLTTKKYIIRGSGQIR